MVKMMMKVGLLWSLGSELVSELVQKLLLSQMVQSL